MGNIVNPPPAAPYSYAACTRDNYQLRHEQFAAWAESNDNADAAARCRDIFTTAIAESLDADQDAGGEGGGGGPIRIVDAGCGSGRDVEAFQSMGKVNGRRVEACGFDICPGFVRLASEKGLDVVEADFFSFFEGGGRKKGASANGLATGDGTGGSGTGRVAKAVPRYHGTFALASLFHVPRDDLRRLILLLHESLHPGGVVLSTIPDCGPSLPYLLSFLFGRHLRIRDGPGGDGRWMFLADAKEQVRLFEDAGFYVVKVLGGCRSKERVEIYNGRDWVLILARKEKGPSRCG